MRSSRRQRRFIAVVAILALLFSQLVVAAHACVMSDQMAQGGSGLHEDPGQKPEPRPHCTTAVAADRAACNAHCTDAAQSDQAKVVSVPLANMGPAPDLSLRLLREPSHASMDRTETFTRFSQRRVVLFGVRLI